MAHFIPGGAIPCYEGRIWSQWIQRQVQLQFSIATWHWAIRRHSLNIPLPSSKWGEWQNLQFFNEMRQRLLVSGLPLWKAIRNVCCHFLPDLDIDFLPVDIHCSSCLSVLVYIYNLTELLKVYAEVGMWTSSKHACMPYGRTRVNTQFHF